MSSIPGLISRLENLDAELAPPSDKKDDADANLDEFGRLKKKCARTVKDARKMIEERDELLEKQSGGGTKQTVEMSARIRHQLRALREDAQRMSDLQRKQQEKAEKKKKGGPSQEEVEHRAEIVDLTWKHIEECEQLEKRRLGGPSASSRTALLSGAGANRNQKAATTTTLKDIDDPELEAGLQQLQKKDQEIDAELDVLSKGVGRLKGIAVDIQSEVKMQNVMVDELTDKVDGATGHLKDLNKKLKDTLEQVGGAQRIIVNVILLVIVLAIVAFAYKTISDNNKSK